MKKTKILFTCLGTGLSLAAITGISVSLASCATSDTKGVFYSSAGDPYKEFSMMAKTLDAVGYKPDSSAGKPTFTDIANDINTNTKAYVKAVSKDLAKLTGINDIKNKTVAFIKNDSISFTPGQSETDKIGSLNKFHMEQPILYSSIYADETAEVPGLGLKFPAPSNDLGLTLFDNWFEIGASALDSGTNSIPQSIADYWSGTCDYVIYLYNSTNFTSQTEKEFVQFVWNDTNNEKLLARNLLKKDAQIKKVIPLDIQFFYNSIFSVYGTENLTRLFTNLLTDSKNGILGDEFGGLNSGYKKRPSTLPALPESGNKARWNKQITSANKISKSTNLTVPADFKNQNNNNTWNKIMTTRYNTISHLVSLGVYPDIVQANGKYDGQDWNTNKDYQYRTIPGLIDQPLSSEQKTAWNSQNGGLMSNVAPGTQPSSTSNYELVDVDFLNSPASNIISKQIYCVATERSNVGKFGNDWSSDNKSTPKPYATTTTSQTSVYKQTRNPSGLSLEELINSGAVGSACYTERNDSSFTQTPYTLYLMVNNASVDLKTYYSTRQDYVTLDPAL